MEEIIKGLVTRIESKDYYVLDENNKLVRCYLRGKFQKEFELKKDKLFTLDIVTVGDQVEFELNQDGTGVIHSIAERRNYLSRKAPRVKGASFRGERLEQIIAANLDYLFIVSSIKKPQFSHRLIDRLLVAGESSDVEVILIINKVDLDKKDHAANWKKFYEEIGYKTYLSSVINKELPAKEIRKMMHGKTSVFWGHSGVGKSSILNFLYPQLNLKVNEVSEYSNKGRHTTVTVRMEKVDDDSFIIDTPGIREIEPYGITKENLSHYFIEFGEIINNCKFNTCTHHHEPGCAVMEAVENGKISELRYDSYLKMLETIEDDVNY